jgi:Predicted signal transduction protein with a C-terminal ATPase domain
MLKFQAFFRNISMTYILIFSFIVVSTIPVISASISTYYKSKQIINMNTAQYIIQMLKQTNGEIELKLDQFNNDATFLVNPTVQQSLNLRLKQELSYQQMKALLEEINRYNAASPKITEISIYTTSGHYIAGLSPNSNTLDTLPLSSSLMKHANDLNGSLFWRYAETDGIHESTVQGIRLIKNMLGPDVTPIGYLSFKLPEELIYDSIAELSLGKTGQAIIADSSGMILSSQNREWIGKQIGEMSEWGDSLRQKEGAFTKTFDGHSYFIAFHTSEATGWKTMGLVPINEMTPGLPDVYKSSIFYQSVWILISIALSLMITQTVVKPIKRLIRAMRGVENGNFEVQANLTGIREFIILSGSFNKMTNRLKELISRVYEEELKEKNAQLKALQAQINPHFLYNTLDTIYWMLYVRGQEKIGDLIVSLSDMLRYSIGKSGPIVTLKEELDNLYNYIHIQSTRFGERIAFEFDIDDTLLHAKSLKLMLQPIVENAITHGIEPSGRPGIIRIRVYQEEGYCCITITDNGVGIPEDKLSEYEKGRLISQGLGLQNVDERIRLTFGEAYGLTITSTTGESTTILYQMPIK